MKLLTLLTTLSRNCEVLQKWESEAPVRLHPHKEPVRLALHVFQDALLSGFEYSLLFPTTGIVLFSLSPGPCVENHCVFPSSGPWVEQIRTSKNSLVAPLLMTAICKTAENTSECLPNLRHSPLQRVLWRFYQDGPGNLCSLPH